MAATDKFYRDQRLLDVVFGVSCILLLLSVVWMMYDDHARPFKVVQRDWRDVEEALYQRAMLDAVPDAERIEALQEAAQLIRDKQAELKQEQDTVMARANQVQVRKAQHEAVYQDIKARHDSVASLVNIAIEERDAAKGKLREHLDTIVAARRAVLDDLRQQLQAAQTEVDKDANELSEVMAPVKAKDRELAQALAPDLRNSGIKVPRQEEIETLAQLEDALKKETTDLDRMAKLAAEKKWKFGDWFRSLPIIDGFASAYKIQQISLEDLTIEYGSFKNVPRYDRCTTCHLGIERAVFDKTALRRLGKASEEDQAKLKSALSFFQARQRQSEKMKDQGLPAESLGFDPDDLSSEVTVKELEEWQVKQYCAHPRLDLFVDSNSPHPAEKFGCTACHAGQSSATDFKLAAHSPNDAGQKREWEKQHHWASSHFWDFPMLPARFIESSCVKCHHQITDLIRYGNKEEAPKLLKGYNLVKELGCFGCHDIAGIKSGKTVGPDLRLEPLPPLEALTPEERLKAQSDPANPPGTMRKVGPSLRRISEKTTEVWTRKWLNSPSGFRPDTRMPHFYNLSTNNAGVLPEDQKAFPNIEMHAITHYLFTEGRAYLSGTDRYRVTNEERLKELQSRKDLTEKERQELAAVQRRLELAPKPVPLAQQVVDAEDKPVAVPAPPADPQALQQAVANGRRLFTERGCLACHAHAGTEKTEGSVLGVVGDAHFGPNLSRIAAKIGVAGQDRAAGRRWLIQWIINPNIHHPRTRMPITHLTIEEAAQVAEWLLSQDTTEVKDWLAEPDVPAPEFKHLVDLTRIYLKKGPGVNPLEVDDVLKETGAETLQGFTAERTRAPLMAVDADEQALKGPVTRDKLLYYIGKKTINRQGCFGCHDIPGFEGAKPIGTPLNDWGKKDPERLAFEDIKAYVKETYNIVEDRDSALDRTKPHGGWRTVNGKRPYEKFFADAIESHRRDGFLHQKLMDPRSYDFHRDLKWDDRLRMPQFKFAHSKAKTGETAEEFAARAEKEEAEAREAVMTFILGLVAEPVHPRYLNQPKPDRMAEVKGRQVLDKYNCAGCHQIRPGIYEFKLSDDTRKLLTLGYDTSAMRESLNADHVFPNHNAWAAPAPPAGQRQVVFGTLPLERNVTPREVRELEVPEDRKVLSLRLSDAMAFTDEQQKVSVYPAGTTLSVFQDQLTSRLDPYGGTLTDLLVPYLGQKDREKYKPDETGESSEARTVLPPPLVREGEKVQPDWLYGFLRKPEVIRPLTILRMPRFNMSEEEAQALVNYFAAADKIGNPGIGLTYPYVRVPERDETYWHDRNTAFVESLARRGKLEGRAQAYLAEAQQRLNAAEAAVSAAKAEPARKAAEQERDAIGKEVKELKEALDRKDVAATKQRLAAADIYWTDAYRLIATTGKSICLDCHRVGTVMPKDNIGPVLDLSPGRVRPDWLERWLANPNRLLTYPSKMPQNFENGKQVFQDLFDDTSREQIDAIRDAVMNLSRVADLPVNRFYRMATTGGK
jgi:mono/diheme cytochrome c family protein